MNNTTFAVCNKATKREFAWYPLEKQLRSLAGLKGAFVVGIFDCCREDFSEAMRDGTG